MAVHTKFERITDPADPRRCQSTSQSIGQCPFKALDGTKYCPRHGGIQGTKKNEAASQRLYRLAHWQDRFAEQADHPKIKGLREELAILRMTLEARFNSCRGDENALVMASGAITNMAREIAKTAQTCHTLEMSMNIVLDKGQAEAWVQKLGQIIALYIDDPEMLAMAAEDMMRSLDEALTPTNT